ncbi:MAG: glycosyltransferase [Candidatus Dormibacteria bacterium]
MSRFAFITWDGGGNVPPAVGIAQELVSRGHDVVFIGYEPQRSRLQARGLRFVALPRSGGFDIYASSDPGERIAGLMANVWACPEHLSDIPDAVKATSSDVVVVDFLMQGALAAASSLPAAVAVLAHSSITGLIPPPESPMGAARLAAANGLRDAAGLGQLSRLNDAWDGYLTLVTTISSLDPAAENAGANLRYVGPIFERFPDTLWDSPWEPTDQRPMVLVSFSTTGLWDQTGRIRNTLDALADEPVRVLVSASQASDLGRLPANATGRSFVPHRLVLPGAAATVTHAGHGTVMASLANGVPVVALPNPVADQPFIAATLQRLGAGVALDGESDPNAIRTAVRDVIHRPSYATAAAMLADEINQSRGPGGAALDLETLASTAHRVHA